MLEKVIARERRSRYLTSTKVKHHLLRIHQISSGESLILSYKLEEYIIKFELILSYNKLNPKLIILPRLITNSR